jgi:hypothetical protein
VKLSGRRRKPPACAKRTAPSNSLSLFQRHITAATAGPYSVNVNGEVFFGDSQRRRLLNLSLASHRWFRQGCFLPTQR